jgi:hypothetical protein
VRLLDLIGPCDQILVVGTRHRGRLLKSENVLPATATHTALDPICRTAARPQRWLSGWFAGWHGSLNQFIGHRGRSLSARRQKKAQIASLKIVNIAAILALSVACASLPVVTPRTQPIQIGINDGFHGTVSPEIFAADCPAMIRSPQTSGPALAAFLTAAPCAVLALIEAPDLKLVEAFARERPAAIELGNELELPPHELTPAQYGQWIRSATAILKAADYRGVVVLGGVYALTDETKQAIKLGISACIDSGLTCRVGVHLYDASDADLAWLRALHWPIWVTEIGAHDNCRPADIAAKKPWLASQLARLSTVPLIERVFIYQRARGSDCSDFSTFGIEGQPAMELLK